MTCRAEPVREGQWTFCPEPAALPGARICGLLRARLLDEITGQPVDADALRVPDERLAAHVRTRRTTGGVVGLAGVPSEAFPRLATDLAQITLAVQVDGYVPLRLAATFAAQPGFPQAFAPVDLGNVGLHRRGVELVGRVVAAGLPRAPPRRAGHHSLEGSWLQAPPAGVSLASSMAAPFVVALSHPLARDWPAAQLDPCDEVPDLANAKQLEQPVPRGGMRLRLSDRQALAVPGPLLIDVDDAGRAEVIAVRAIDAGQPCWIELEQPTQFLHRERARVLPLAVTPVAGACALSRAAVAGDGVAFLATAPPWPTGRLVRIGDGVRPPEYRRIARHEAVSDGQGHFRLPLLSRLACVQLRATHASRPAPLRAVPTLDYRVLRQDLLLAFE
jgi:hypothetical protein